VSRVRCKNNIPKENCISDKIYKCNLNTETPTTSFLESIIINSLSDVDGWEQYLRNGWNHFYNRKYGNDEDFHNIHSDNANTAVVNTVENDIISINTDNEKFRNMYCPNICNQENPCENTDYSENCLGGAFGNNNFGTDRFCWQCPKDENNAQSIDTCKHNHVPNQNNSDTCASDKPICRSQLSTKEICFNTFFGEWFLDVPVISKKCKKYEDATEQERQNFNMPT